MSSAIACQASLSVGASAFRTQCTTSKALIQFSALHLSCSSQSARSVPTQTRTLLTSSFVSPNQSLISKQLAHSPKSALGSKAGGTGATVMAAESAYDFKVKDIDGNETDLSKFKGKVSLIVNVASACGLTKQNYQELTTVYDKLKGKDFEVLAFPCNQFGGQEPGSADEIKKFAGDKYGATYPLFSKVDVNGAKADPLFQYLKKEAGGGDISWNFGKFLVGKDGQVLKRFDPRTNPLAIESEIESAL